MKITLLVSALCAAAAAAPTSVRRSDEVSTLDDMNVVLTSDFDLDILDRRDGGVPNLVIVVDADGYTLDRRNGVSGDPAANVEVKDVTNNLNAEVLDRRDGGVSDLYVPVDVDIDVYTLDHTLERRSGVSGDHPVNVEVKDNNVDNKRNLDNNVDNKRNLDNNVDNKRNLDNNVDNKRNLDAFDRRSGEVSVLSDANVDVSDIANSNLVTIANDILDAST